MIVIQMITFFCPMVYSIVIPTVPYIPWDFPGVSSTYEP